MGSRVKKKTIMDVVLSSPTNNIDFIGKIYYKASEIECAMIKLEK